MKPKTWFLMLIAICFLSLTGCGEFYKFYSIDTSLVFERYHQTTLKFSTSADVLGVIYNPEIELLSQSESVVVSCGEKKKGSILWFNAVAFDEDELTAIRKYAFVADEKVKGFYVRTVQKLRFSAQVVLSEDILAEPYANKNARRIAVLRRILAGFKEDLIELTSDSQTLDSAVMMTVQALNGILVKLDRSPALAAKLTNPAGLEFDHMTLGKGTISLSIDDDIADTTIKVVTKRLTMTLTP